MVDCIDFFRLFDFLTCEERSKWSILLNFYDYSTSRPGWERLNGRFNEFFRPFDPGGGSKWSMLLIFF